jgi:hypothetical protein
MIPMNIKQLSRAARRCRETHEGYLHAKHCFEVIGEELPGHLELAEKTMLSAEREAKKARKNLWKMIQECQELEDFNSIFQEG